MTTRTVFLALALAISLDLHAAAAKDRPVVVDTHVDTPTEWVNSPFDVGARNTTHHFDFPRMKEGGVDAVFLVAYVPARLATKGGSAAHCLTLMESIRKMVGQSRGTARLATSTAEIRSAARDGKRAVLIGIEGGHAIEDSLDVLRSFHRLGARYMTLTHTNTNNWADSSGDKPKHDGLSPFGREVVLEMNRLGMLVDVSHVSDATFYDVIETTKAPVIASHSSARALARHSRNMTDDMLRAVAKNGGVVMVNFYPTFISNEYLAAFEARAEKLAEPVKALREKYPDGGAEFERAVDELRAGFVMPKVDWKVAVDHIEHVAKIAGIDHVGIGSDFDGIDDTPVGLEDISKMPKVRDELKRRGFSAADIDKIMGENFMRVFARAEAVAREIAKK